MSAYADWLNLALRWLHLTTGIAWIGSSFYFVWLDNHLKPPADGEGSGELWAVHGGGFYHNRKYLVAPERLPDDLHWFKWEAYWTWISGFSLLVLVYYLGAKAYLIDPARADLTPVQAIGIGLGTLAGGWLAYDGLCRSPLGRNTALLGALWYLLLVAIAFGLTQVFSARGAFLHVGALVGTVMVGNVFFIIIPNQRKVVAALKAGLAPDPALGKAGKQRSLHNNYMTLPVLFIMISHHYPMTYGAAQPWLVLALIGLLGAGIRHLFNLRHRGVSSPPLVAGLAVLAMGVISYVSAQKAAPAGAGAEDGGPVYATIAPILSRHCTGCHAARPTNPLVSAPPLGIVLDSYTKVAALAPRIKAVAVDSDVMPMGNQTGMTAAERQTLGRWIEEGTPR